MTYLFSAAWSLIVEFVVAWIHNMVNETSKIFTGTIAPENFQSMIIPLMTTVGVFVKMLNIKSYGK